MKIDVSLHRKTKLMHIHVATPRLTARNSYLFLLEEIALYIAVSIAFAIDKSGLE